MKLYLIRHAESANNVLYGSPDEASARSPDPEITDTGHHQASALARHLANPGNGSGADETIDNASYGLTHLYCSLMTRSMVTADYVARACEIKLEALPDIFERKGIYEFDGTGREIGLPGPGRSYFSERFPEVSLPPSVNHSGWWNRPAETDEQFVIRVKQSLEDVKQRHAHTDDCVGMVVHGDYINQCINELTGTQSRDENGDARCSNWVLHNTSISCFDVIPGSHDVVYLNRIDHLQPELVTT